MIKTTLGAVIQAEPVLQRLNGMVLPLKSAYTVSKLCRLIEQDIAIFSEKRTALIKDLGAEREATEQEQAAGMQGLVTEVLPENRQQFAEQLSELLAIDVTVDWQPLKLNALGDIQIRGVDLDALGPFIDVSE